MTPLTRHPKKTTVDTNDVDEFLDTLTNTYESDPEAYIALFRGDATFFLASSEGRIDGAREYRRLLDARDVSNYKRSMTIESPEIRTFSNVALATYQSRLTVDEKSVRTRVTLVLTPDDLTGDLKVAHLHTSLLDDPEVTAMPPSIEKIAIIEERVATAIAATGTPK